MNDNQLIANEIAKALRQIIRIDDNSLIVGSKEAAEELSQIFLDSGKGGVITGPFLEPVNNFPKRVVWYIETN